MRFDAFFTSFYGALLASPRRWLVVILLAAFLPISGVSLVEFSTDYRIFFGGADTHVKEFDAQQRTYAKTDNILIAIEPSDKRYVFDLQLLKTIKHFTKEAWKLPHVTRVDSITNFQDSFADGDELIIDDLVNDVSGKHSFSLDRVRKVALTEPALVNRLVSKNGRYTGINLTVHMPEGRQAEEIPRIVAAVRALAQDLKAEASVENVYLSGTVMINNAFYEVSKDDLMTLIPAMFVVILIFMMLLIRSISATLLVFGIVGLAVGITFGVGAFLGIRLTPPSASAAPIVMMLSIADCVHVLMGYFKAYRQHGDKNLAMQTSLRANFTPVTLTSITTVIGFLTMNFSASPPFHDLGNLVAIGAIAAYVLTMLLLPLVQLHLPVPNLPEKTFLERFVIWLGNWVVGNKKTLVGITLILMVSLFLFIPRNELNDEFIKYFDKTVTFRTDNDFITENLTGVYQIEYSLSAGHADGINQPDYLRKLEEFAVWYRQQKFVLHVQTISDVYKKANMNLHNGEVDAYRLPASRDLAAQALLAYEMSLPFGLDLNDQINVDKSASKFAVSLETISANEIIHLEKKAEAWLASNAPDGMQAIGTGPAVLFAHIGKNSIRSGLIGGVAALLLICALLSFVFRSAKIGLISLVPNLFPAAMAFGVWGIVHGQINMALATVLSMTLGIVVDDTIHFISKYRRGLQAGLTADGAVRHAFEHVGVAITITSIVLIAGFLVLTLSPFAMNWGMGLLSAITIAFALMTDLLLLPAILIVFQRRTHAALIPESPPV